VVGEVRDGKQRWSSGLAPAPYPVADNPPDCQPQRLGFAESICPWEFTAEGGASVATNDAQATINYEDSLNCGGLNPNRQSATVRRELFLNAPRDVVLELTGRVERQHANFDVANVSVNGINVLSMHGEPDLLGCAMALKTATASVTLPIGLNSLEFEGDTVDGQYHVNAFHRLRLTVLGKPIVNSDYWGGFPVHCYREEAANPGQLTTVPDIQDRGDQLILINMIIALYADVDAAVNLVQLYMGPRATVIGFPDDASDVPGIVIGQREDYNLVILTGTSNFWQASLYSLYSTIPLVPFADFHTNLQWRIAASAEAVRLSAAGVDWSKKTVLIGHSYGGAIATNLAGSSLGVDPNRQIDVLTFGGATPGDLLLKQLMRRARYVRISNVGDPVPSLPPNLTEYAPYLNVLIPGLIFAWNDYRQPLGQLRLDQDGNVFEDEDSTFSIGYLARAIASAIGGPALPTEFAHLSAEYARRLQAAIDAGQ